MAAAVIPAKSGDDLITFAGLLSRGDGMIDMALPHLQRFGSCAVAVATTGLGLVAQVDPKADPSVGQIGAGTALIGATYLIIAVIREGTTPFLKWAEIQATNRNERVRMQAALDQAKAQREDDAARIANLEKGLAAAQQEARDARNLVENAKVAAEARADEIEKKAREAGHLARNTAQRVEIASQRLDDVERAVSGSGEIDAGGAI